MEFYKAIEFTCFTKTSHRCKRCEATSHRWLRPSLASVSTFNFFHQQPILNYNEVFTWKNIGTFFKLLLQIRVFELRFIGYPSVKDNWLMVRKNRKITRHLTVVALAMTYPAAARSACHQSPRIHSCSLPKKVAMMEKVNKYAVKLLLCRSLFGALLFGSLSSAAFRVTDKKFRLILNWPLTHDIDTIELCFCTTLTFLNPILHFMGQK